MFCFQTLGFETGKTADTNALPRLDDGTFPTSLQMPNAAFVKETQLFNTLAIGASTSYKQGPIKIVDSLRAQWNDDYLRSWAANANLQPTFLLTTTWGKFKNYDFRLIVKNKVTESLDMSRF